MKRLIYFFGGVIPILLFLNCEGDLPQLPELELIISEVNLLDSLHLEASITGISKEDIKDQLRIDDCGFMLFNAEGDELYTIKGKKAPANDGFSANKANIGLNEPLIIVAFLDIYHKVYKEKVFYTDTIRDTTDRIIFIHEIAIENNRQLTIQSGILNEVKESDVKAVGHVWKFSESEVLDGELNLDINNGQYSVPEMRRIYESNTALDELTLTIDKRHIFTRGYVKYRDTTVYGEINHKKLGNFWVKIASNTEAVGCRNGAVSFVAGEYAYVGLGNISSNCNQEDRSFRDDFWRYHPDEGWTPIKKFGGGPRMDAVAFVIGERIFVGLGRTTPSKRFQDLWEYHPFPDDCWSRKKSFPQERSKAVAFSDGEFGYVGTGEEETTNRLNYKNDFYIFNPKGVNEDKNNRGNWDKLSIDTLPDLDESTKSPLVRINATAFTVPQKGYFSSGLAQDKIPQGPSSIPTNRLNDLWEYDASKSEGSRWSKKNNLPGNPREAAISFSNGIYGYMLAGGNSTCPTESNFYQYDTEKDEWKELGAMKNERRGGLGFAINNQFYAGFGFILNSETNQPCDANLYQYIPQE